METTDGNMHGVILALKDTVDKDKEHQLVHLLNSFVNQLQYGQTPALKLTYKQELEWCINQNIKDI